MKRKRRERAAVPWFDFVMLGLEAQQVIWLRMMKFAAGGPATHRESTLMVSEKIAAAAIAAQQMMLGASPKSVVGSYRKKVRANVRRLLK